MLVLTRKEGEQIAVPGCEPTLTVLGIQGKRVRLGVSAPSGVAVHRKEVMDRIAPHLPEETASAVAEEAPMSVRVLIADPDAYLLASYREFLERHGFEVLTATDGLECVARLRDSSPDVLVMDPALPWGWGDGVLAMMHEDADVPLIPVIVLTDGRDRSLLYHLARFPLQGYYVKPLGANRLMERIGPLARQQYADKHSTGAIR